MDNYETMEANAILNGMGAGQSHKYAVGGLREGIQGITCKEPGTSPLWLNG